jgi:hypothetical protein
MTQSVDGDVSYTLRNNQSTGDTFDECLEKELQHLDISGELKVKGDGASSSQRDDDGSASVPRPPICYRQVSQGTASSAVLAPDAPARVPVRRESQFIAHDVSSLTEDSMSSGANRKPPKKPVSKNSKTSSSSSSPKNNKKSGTILQRFCSIAVTSLDTPLGPPKRRFSKQVFRASSPGAF